MRTIGVASLMNHALNMAQRDNEHFSGHFQSSFLNIIYPWTYVVHTSVTINILMSLVLFLDPWILFPASFGDRGA